MTTANASSDRTHDTARANPLGAYIATLGSLILLVSVFLNWTGLGPGDTDVDAISGYESDGIIPWMALFAVGLSLAMLYALGKADRRQHRGLSLASMAAGIASLAWIILFIIDPISTYQYPLGDGGSPNISTEFGAYIGAIGALLWAVGSYLLAKEPEGEIDRHEHRTAQPQVRAQERTHTGGHGEVTEHRPANVTDRDVTERHRVAEDDTTGVRHTEHGQDHDVTRNRRDEPGTRR